MTPQTVKPDDRQPSRQARQQAHDILMRHPPCLRDGVPLDFLIEDIAAAIDGTAAAPEMLAALKAQEAAELNRNMECEECGGEGEPEACSLCFPAFDDARIKRRAAIAKAEGRE